MIDMQESGELRLEENVIGDTHQTLGEVVEGVTIQKNLLVFVLYYPIKSESDDGDLLWKTK